MPLFTSKKQLAIKAEDVASVIPAGSMTSAANATLLLKNASLVPEIESLEQEFLRDGFTPSPNQVGAKTAVLDATFDLKGTSGGEVADGAPNFSPLLQAAMMVEEPLTILTIGAVSGTGPFIMGEIVTGTAGTGRVLKECHNGETSLYITPITGAITNGALSAPSGAVATSTNTNSVGGFAWTPTSVVEQSMTVVAAVSPEPTAGDTFRGVDTGAMGRVSEDLAAAGTTLKFLPLNNIAFDNDEVLELLGPGAYDATYQTVGAASAQTYTKGHSLSCRLYEDGIATTAKGMRTNCSFSLAVNRPAEVQVTGRGALDAVGDVANISAVSLDFTTAPVWNSAVMTIGLPAKTTTDDDYAPCLEALTYDFGNELNDVFCASSATGLREVVTTGRSGTGTMDPEATPESVFPWVGKWQDGTLANFDVEVGTALGNKFILTWPALQTTGAPVTDKNGRMARSIAFRATGGERTITDDNEFTLLYLTSA
jgi:hypothetical protein